MARSRAARRGGALGRLLVTLAAFAGGMWLGHGIAVVVADYRSGGYGYHP